VNDLVIVLGITKEWAFAAGNVLLGLKDKMENFYDIFVFHDGISEEDKRKLNCIHPCSFRTFDFRIIDPCKIARVSKMAFSRFMIFNLLDTYKTALWLDSDILIIKDITKIVSYAPSGIGMYKHLGIPMRISFSQDVKDYDMEATCYNDGIIVVTRTLDFGDLFDWCLRATNEHIESINSDQAVMNMMLQKFDISVTDLPEEYNCHPNRVKDSTRIIHPWGNKKFWKGLENPQWDEQNKKWNSL
jgi:lipopolysaccharide biosynthesis glycosyltransferase